MAPHAFKTIEDAGRCQVINPKEVEQNLSCYGGYVFGEDSTEQDITLKSNDSLSLLIDNNTDSSTTLHRETSVTTSSSCNTTTLEQDDRSIELCCGVDAHTSTNHTANTDSYLISPCRSLCKNQNNNNYKSNNSSRDYITSSDDDGYFCSNYDADDEEYPTFCDYRKHKNDNDNVDINSELNTSSNNTENNNDARRERLDTVNSAILDIDDDEDLFCFRRKTDLTIHTFQDTLQILQSRPKLTDRLYCNQEDSDDCFRESEYDVIDTDTDEDDVVEVINGTTLNTETSRIEIKVRAHTMNEEGRLIEVKTTPVRDRNKLKIGKVRSLPGIRFPIRKNGRSGSSSRKYYRSTSEISLTTPSKSQQKLDTVYDELVLQSDYFSRISGATPNTGKSRRSESDGQQGLTSDADYLTTVHANYNSNDSLVDTNLDTQAEDIPPTKFLSAGALLKAQNKKKRKAVQRLDFGRTPNSPVDTTTTNDTALLQMNSNKGRFQVTTVQEAVTPDFESNKDFNKITPSEAKLPLSKKEQEELAILNSYEII